MINSWTEMQFWRSGEWDVVQERLDYLDVVCTVYNPTRELLFCSLDRTPLDRVTVVMVGQDPYPDHKLATGLAFSIPPSAHVHPPTLRVLLTELEDDLHYTYPKNGCLEKWADQGVLLWNAVPSCEAGKTLSHNWDEWTYLTKEIIETASRKGNVVFVFLGGVARRFATYVDTDRNSVIETGHPSPRGNMASKTPFSGSRVFSRINGLLSGSPIDWKLEGYGWQPGTKHSARLSQVSLKPF